MNLINTDFINQKDKAMVEAFISSTRSKKYILGINKFTKQVQKHVEVDGIIDDFTRVQTSRKKKTLCIEEVPEGALILCTASGSPLEVQKELDKRGFEHFNYLAFYKYSPFELKAPDFISDFADDYRSNKSSYEKTYALLADEKSKEVFEKVINFKISFDLDFMQGFSNNHSEQYFDKEIISSISNISFVDAGGYVGDTLPHIIKYFPDFKKIYCIEPSTLHLNIAKRDFGDYENIEFINCGVGKHKQLLDETQTEQNECNHNHQTLNINTIDNLISQKVDYIKMDIEGAEQDALWGAQQTIIKYHPILAVCIYHKAEDWYQVPQIVLSFRDDYDIYLRHYMEGIYETVMYFIPRKMQG